jgi:aldehyde:ferredoxin oxidoreductase
MSSVKDGRYAGTIVEGPEYETLFAFGGLCELADIKAIAKANEVCDLLGLDTISSGNVIGFAMRAYELGKIQSPFPIKFGDDEVTMKLLNLIAMREDIGNTLADGVRIASKSLGIQRNGPFIRCRGQRGGPSTFHGLRIRDEERLRPIHGQWQSCLRQGIGG